MISVVVLQRKRTAQIGSVTHVMAAGLMALRVAAPATPAKIVPLSMLDRRQRRHLAMCILPKTCLLIVAVPHIFFANSDPAVCAWLGRESLPCLSVRPSLAWSCSVDFPMQWHGVCSPCSSSLRHSFFLCLC